LNSPPEICWGIKRQRQDFNLRTDTHDFAQGFECGVQKHIQANCLPMSNWRVGHDPPGNAKTSSHFIGMVSSMTPELETLDQLQGSDLPLEIILRRFPDADAFRRGVMGLIACGDVCILTVGGIEVPAWRHRNYSSMDS
jgi:hypothetical protein